MLRRIRLTLTALYATFGALLILVMGVGSYALLTTYFSASNDVILRWSIAQQYKQSGARLPGDLAEADRSWMAPAQSRSSSDEHDDHDEDRHTNPALAPVFLVALRSDGRPVQSGLASPLAPDTAALASALRSGQDIRTVHAPGGERVRLATYPLAGPGGQVAVQAGRLLDDQDRLMTSLVAGLLGVGLISSAFLGTASWWLSGRSIAPTERAWAHQQQFVANAGHELRTPLTLIRASAEVARRGANDPETAELLDDILRECDYMAVLTDDLLLLSRLDAGQLKLQKTTVPLTGLFDDLHKSMGRVAAERGMQLTVEPAELQVRGDPDRIRQILLILIDNALRHCPAGSHVQVGAAKRDRSVVFTVRDDGEGIAPEHLDKVFDRFYRVDSTRGTGKGTGLGLAVAKSLVEAQGGEIAIRSRPGEGTEASFSLPAGERSDSMIGSQSGTHSRDDVSPQRV